MDCSTKKRSIDLDTESFRQDSKRQTRQKDQLHVEGFVVHKNLVEITPNVLQDLSRQSARAQIIFNGVNQGSVVKGDGKRKQFKLGRSKIAEALTTLMDDKLSNLSPHKRSPWVVIQSLAGCQEQPPHTDYEPLADLPLEEIPLALLLAVMPNTKLHVWPRSIGLNTDASRITSPIAKQTIELEPGDAVLFRGDLVHAGAAYQQDHLRMHCYLDTATVKRATNATWLIDSDSVDSRLRSAIQP